MIFFSRKEEESKAFLSVFLHILIFLIDRNIEDIKVLK